MSSSAEHDSQPATVSAPAAEAPEVLTAEPAPMQPVQLGERMEIMDILRGFALLASCA